MEEEKQLKKHSKEYKYFLANGGQEVHDELMAFFGKQGAYIAITKSEGAYTCFINIAIKRFVDSGYKRVLFHIYEKYEDYKELPKILENYKLKLWGLLTAKGYEKFKVRNKVYKKQELIDILKLEDE